MNDDGHVSALTRGFFELICPAPVIGHGLAVEKRSVAGGIAGIVHEHHYGLASGIHARIVIPVVFRCDNAVADKYHIAVTDIDFIDDAPGTTREAATHGQVHQLTVVSSDHEVGMRITGDFDQRDGLGVAVPVARHEAQLLEFSDQERHGLFLSH